MIDSSFLVPLKGKEAICVLAFDPSGPRDELVLRKGPSNTLRDAYDL